MSAVAAGAVAIEARPYYEAMYEAAYFASLGIWAVFTVMCFGFYARELLATLAVLREMSSALGPDEMPGVRLFDAYASKQVCVTALCIVLCQAGLITLGLIIVPPHTAELTLRALIGRGLSIASVAFLLGGYLKWRKFRDDERRQSAFKARMDEVKRSVNIDTQGEGDS